MLSFTLEDGTGGVLHRNFTTFLVADGPSPRLAPAKINGREVRLLRFAPNQFTSAQWSVKQWNVFDGLKVNGAGQGYFEYRLPWPQGLDPQAIASAQPAL